MEAVLVTSRLAEFSASMLLFGAASFRLYFRAEFAAACEIQKPFDRWLRQVMMVAAVIALVALAAWLDIEAVTMGDGWTDALNAHTISAVLLQTEFGGAWSWHLAFGVAALALILSVRRRLLDTAQNVLLSGVSAALVASTAWAGHAVMHSGAAGLAALTTQIAHLLATSAWLGSLPALGYILYRAQDDPQGGWRAATQYILPGYSRMGYLAVGLILLTGCLNSWFMVDGIDALFSTTYGRVLIVKVGLFVLMVCVALFNRFALTPELLKPKAKTLMTETAFARLWRNVAIEQLLGLSIIAAVCVLGTLPPAMAGDTG
jgi:putative copper resistance protein D